jgi:hypothetical protein
MAKVDQEEFLRVCHTAQLVERKAKFPRFTTKDGKEGVELENGKIKPFVLKNAGQADAELIYDQPVQDKIICAVIGAFEDKPEPQKEAIKASKKAHDDLKEPEKVNVEIIPQKESLVIGTVSALAGSYGIPPELANMFFMKFDNQLYIKNPGLLWLASKKGYGHMEVSDKFNSTTNEWEAEYKIFPVLTKEIIESISKLDATVQEKALLKATEPTNGLGHAGNATIKMKTMLVFARDLAQTRAQNRAMRAYTGYGGTSAEELEQS